MQLTHQLMSQFSNVNWCDTFTSRQPFQPFFGFIFNSDEESIMNLTYIGTC